MHCYSWHSHGLCFALWWHSHGLCFALWRQDRTVTYSVLYILPFAAFGHIFFAIFFYSKQARAISPYLLSGSRLLILLTPSHAFSRLLTPSHAFAL